MSYSGNDTDRLRARQLLPLVRFHWGFVGWHGVRYVLNHEKHSTKIKLMKTNIKLTFEESVNWEYVHAHHKADDGKVLPGPWCQTLIEHAKRHGRYSRKITERGACRIINRNLY